MMVLMLVLNQQNKLKHVTWSNCGLKFLENMNR